MAPMDPRIFIPTTSPVAGISIDATWVNRLEASNSFTLPEKIHFLRMALGQQWLCDVAPLAGRLRTCRTEIEELGFATSTHGGWILAGVNRAALEYVDFRTSGLTEIEAGVLYGYPPSAILAFGSIVPRSRVEITSAADFYLGGVDSDDAVKSNRQLRSEQWQALQVASPGIIKQAEESFYAWLTSYHPIQQPFP